MPKWSSRPKHYLRYHPLITKPGIPSEYGRSYILRRPAFLQAFSSACHWYRGEGDIARQNPCQCALRCCGFECGRSTSPVRQRRDTRLAFFASRGQFSSCRTRDPGRRRGPSHRCVSGVRPGSSSMFCAQWPHFGKPVGRFPYH